MSEALQTAPQPLRHRAYHTATVVAGFILFIGGIGQKSEVMRDIVALEPTTYHSYKVLSIVFLPSLSVSLSLCLSFFVFTSLFHSFLPLERTNWDYLVV